MKRQRAADNNTPADSASPRRVAPDSSSDTPLTASRPLIIGHRGASALAPENTLAAFRLALDSGADGLEFDVRLARDGVPVVIHDSTLKRTCLRDDLVSDFDATTLRRLDAGTWFNRRFPRRARAEYADEGVPALAEMLTEMGPRARALYVELKFERGEDFAPLVARTVELVRALDLSHNVIIESFAHEAVAEAKRLAPELRTAALFEARAARPLIPARELISRTRACGANEAALHYLLARRGAVEALREAGLGVVVWTVDRPAWAARARAHGLRGIITNHPARMRVAFDCMGEIA